eukprot:scaffold153799_cov29-Tisochrysis_lutea.AAC.10
MRAAAAPPLVDSASIESRSMQSIAAPASTISDESPDRPSTIPELVTHPRKAFTIAFRNTRGRACAGGERAPSPLPLPSLLGAGSMAAAAAAAAAATPVRPGRGGSDGASGAGVCNSKIAVSFVNFVSIVNA